MRKGERRRQELVDAATTLFFARGYEDTSVNDILDAVGCSKGSFYHHFESKMELLAAIAKERAAAGFEAFSGEAPEDDPIMRLDRLLYHACPFRGGEELFLKNLIQLMRAREAAALEQALLEATDELFYPAFLSAVAALNAEGEGTDEAACFMIWQSFLNGSLLILRQAASVPIAGRARSIQLLRALRAQVESALYLPFGSLIILEAEEMAGALEDALGEPGPLA